MIPGVMKLKSRIASIALLSLVALSPVRAGKLSDIIESEGLGWMMGTWKASIDSGELKLVYKMDLDGNVVTVHFKGPERESKGMIGVKPGTDEVVYGVMDSQGGAGMGKWEEVGGHPALNVKYANGDGEDRSMVFVHRKIDADTMAVDVHGVDDGGTPSTDPLWTIEWKRQS